MVRPDNGVPNLAGPMLYEQSTQGIRIRVEPSFSLGDSDLSDQTFVFAYHIEVANEGDEDAQLLFRHWHIHDSAGEDTEVDGEGVVGQQPYLVPGEAHRYRSYCVLRSPTGYMEGHYTFVRPDGALFQVPVPRFHLKAPLTAAPDDDRDELLH